MSDKEISFSEFLESVALPLFFFAIVNPMGPTFMMFAIGRISSRKSCLMFASLNPFSQSAKLISDYSFDTETLDIRSLLTSYSISEDIENYVFTMKKNNQEFGTPTILFGSGVDFSNNQSVSKEQEIIFNIIKYSSDPKKTLDNLKQFPMNVKERVSYEMQDLSIFSSTDSNNKDLISDKIIHELMGIVCLPEHIKQEFLGFVYAWNGSINFQKKGNTGIADNALEFQTFFKIVSTLNPSLEKVVM